MKAWNLIVFASLLIAATSPVAASELDTFTPSGKKYVENCASQTQDNKTLYRAKICARLFKQWRLEIQLRERGVADADLAHLSRLMMTGRLASAPGLGMSRALPFDTERWSFSPASAN